MLDAIASSSQEEHDRIWRQMADEQMARELYESRNRQVFDDRQKAIDAGRLSEEVDGISQRCEGLPG